MSGIDHTWSLCCLHGRRSVGPDQRSAMGDWAESQDFVISGDRKPFASWRQPRMQRTLAI